MKRFFLLILLLFSTILPIYSQTLITQQDAWDIVQQKVLEENIQDILQRQDESIEELKKAEQNNK